MRIAIMGAGLSGLACAITLERHGIQPTIFEKRSQVGDRFINSEALLSILNRPVNDSLAYLADRYGIFLKPTANIKEMSFYSESSKAVLTGQLGFNNIRGRHKDSFEAQLKEQVKSQIIFNSGHSYEDLLKEFTHVVLATGDGEYAKRIQQYREDVTFSLKGAIVKGFFSRFTTSAWLDNRFAPGGYAYLIPMSETEANMVITYPDTRTNQKKDIEALWSVFWEKASKDYDQCFELVDQFQIRRYIAGICQKARIGNTFFVGNNFGSIMPFLGFGQFVAILTGIYAALDLCGEGSYEKLTQPLRKAYHNSLVLRRFIQDFSNKRWDFVVKTMNSPFVNKVFDTPTIDPFKTLSYLVRPFTPIKK
ncbi:MAG: NAD(P)/FAD-dependent oxidoreductase [Clostridia bacterium]|nr:NAD(P)/FAD-dependent oxidoreductase [Clostridia bacterium]